MTNPKPLFHPRSHRIPGQNFARPSAGSATGALTYTAVQTMAAILLNARSTSAPAA